MQNNKVVLDTNCLLASLSRLGSSYPVWKSFQEGKYILCVTTEILAEYEEIISQKTTSSIAKHVVELILKSKNVQFVNTYFHWNLITTDPDDNKFVDCAIVCGADYIVSNDAHFKCLQNHPFPVVNVISLDEFAADINVSR